MISLTATALLVFGRLAGLLAAMPLTSARGVPRYVAVLGAIGIGGVLVPLVPGAPVPSTIGALLLGMAGELMLGVVMGATVSALFGAIAIGADLMSQQSGFHLASFFNPLSRARQGAMATLASLLGGVVFLSANLHLACVGVLARSFELLPPGTTGALVPGAATLMQAVADSIVLGVRLAGPVLLLVWIVDVFVAVLTRLAPQMNVFFSVGMVLTAVAGVALFAVALPYVLGAWQGVVATAPDRLLKLVEALH